MKARIDRGKPKPKYKYYDALHDGLKRREVEAFDAIAIDYDTKLLYTVRKIMGWGRRRLLRFYASILTTHAQMHGDWQDSKYRAMRYQLRKLDVDYDGMASAADRWAMGLAAQMDRYTQPQALGVDGVIVRQAEEAARESGREYELLNIYILYFDFGCTRPQLQRIMNELALHRRTYEYRRDADEHMRMRDELLAIGVNVIALQNDADACIAAELQAEKNGGE